MSQFVLSPAAQADLDAIWDYTADHWSTRQADKYVLSIREACQQLVEGRRQSEPIDDVRPGYRKSAISSHVIFFRTGHTGLLDVVRILHQRMNHSAHFGGENLEPD
jgi:toxin ParE1/3/4